MLFLILSDWFCFLPVKSRETVAASGLGKRGCGQKVGQGRVRTVARVAPSFLIRQLPDYDYDCNSGMSHIITELINICCRASPRGAVVQWGSTLTRCKSAAISHHIKTTDSLSEQDWSSRHPVKLCLENPDWLSHSRARHCPPERVRVALFLLSDPNVSLWCSSRSQCKTDWFKKMHNNLCVQLQLLLIAWFLSFIPSFSLWKVQYAILITVRPRRGLSMFLRFSAFESVPPAAHPEKLPPPPLEIARSNLSDIPKKTHSNFRKHIQLAWNEIQMHANVRR